MTKDRQIKELENRITHLEGVLSVFLSNNYHNIVGGWDFCERSIKLLNGKQEMKTSGYLHVTEVKEVKPDGH
jgi:hypothetical protein